MLSSKDIQFMPFVLSDVNVIELLIRYRYKYDENLYLKDFGRSRFVDGETSINEEMIAVYLDLDRLIKECKFDKVQVKMIKMLEHGYEQNEIAEELGLREQTIEGRMKTIFRRIKQQNDWNWRKAVYKKSLELKTKECNKCKEELPATSEFFSTNNDSKDGFYSLCKICRN
ncbi:LuxR C-terminal-related transcriptional regulator [Siminovitchia sp. 179-K 8D1 HS]